MNLREHQSHSAWLPWRGLSLALLLALLMHIAALMLARNHFVLSFQRPDNSASMRTRLLEPLPASLGQPAPEPLPAPIPEKSQTAEPSAEPVRLASKQARSVRTAKEPAQKPKNEQNQPLALIEYEHNAIESIASIRPTAVSDLPKSATQSTAAAVAPSIKLRYPPSAQLLFEGTFMRKGVAISATGVLDWKSDGASYALSLETQDAQGNRRLEKSIGQLSAQGLAPQRYSSTGTGRSEQATHFRADLRKIQFSNNKPQEELLLGAQDQLSALIQLAGIIGGDPERYRIVNRLAMQVAGLGSAEVWEFNIETLSDIHLPAANMQALKISRNPRHEFDQRLELWLSPPLGYLPVRIRQSASSQPEQDFTDLMLRKLP